MLHQAEMMNCIMCGACVSDCTSLAVDPSFLGPAALAKAYRFVADPRDGKTDDRLRNYSEPSGIWDCAHCFMCVEVCPKDVKPMERIMAIREQAVKAGYTDNGGARHLLSFAESVEHSGGLDETKLAVDSVGWTNIGGLLQLAPVGIRAALRNKVPRGFVLHKKRPGHEHIKRIFEKLEDK
jgi:succinate dehydrogenase / fumarate reductase iron-sulfur subunit